MLDTPHKKKSAGLTAVIAILILLLFFMIASTLAKQLNTIEVKLPQGEGKTENRNTVAVTITEQGRFFIDEARVTKSRLEDQLIQALSGANKPSLVLRAEQKVAIDEVVFVMNIANKNGIKVVLAVDKP